VFFFCFSGATVSAVNCLVVLPPLLLQLPLCHTLQIKFIDWLNGWKYPKSADDTNYGNSSCVWWEKSGELWSINGLEFHVSLDPLKCTFLADYISDYISAHRGCCALKILHALEIDQALIAHTRSWTGVPTKKFNRENLKFGLKFSVLVATITSGLVGVSPQNIFHTTCHGIGVITWV